MSAFGQFDSAESAVDVFYWSALSVYGRTPVFIVQDGYAEHACLITYFSFAGVGIVFEGDVRNAAFLKLFQGRKIRVLNNAEVLKDTFLREAVQIHPEFYRVILKRDKSTAASIGDKGIYYGEFRYLFTAYGRHQRNVGVDVNITFYLKISSLRDRIIGKLRYYIGGASGYIYIKLSVFGSVFKISVFGNAVPEKYLFFSCLLRDGNLLKIA